MSFAKYKDQIEYGDTVIIYMGFDNMVQFRVEKNAIRQTKFGAVKHDSLIGKRFGCKLSCSRGYVYVLHPTPELWTINLPHRTQILYSTDISMITTQLDLKPGSIVIEAGTGSASLSHAILRTIAPDGHLHTFDFHEQRVKTARDEFLAHGFDDTLVTAALRDVCTDGFDIDSATADAVFLDLPSPWLVMPFATQCLKPGGRLCSFSPCIEQVQRSCSALRDAGFTDITTLECLQRVLDVRSISVPVANLGYGPANLSAVTELDDDPVTGHIETVKSSRHQKLKNIKHSSDAGANNSDDNVRCADADEHDGTVAKVSNETHSSEVNWESRKQPHNKASYNFKSAVPVSQMTGHTGYLTFATLYPK